MNNNLSLDIDLCNITLFGLAGARQEAKGAFNFSCVPGSEIPDEVIGHFDVNRHTDSGHAFAAFSSNPPRAFYKCRMHVYAYLIDGSLKVYGFDNSCITGVEAGPFSSHRTLFRAIML